jgi:retinol-binding protein 3
MLRRTAAVALALIVLTDLPGHAQTPVFDGTVRSAVIDSLKAQLIQRYVSEDTARMIGAVLDRHLKAGAYDTLRTPARFAEVVSRHLRSINNDGHLGLAYQPNPPAPQGQAPAGPPPNPGRGNYGLTRIEILPGNIGYLEITGFNAPRGYDEAVAHAMRVLQNTDALIIDVRRNGGGSSAYSHLVFSYFLPEKPVETIRTVQRTATNVRSSVATVAGPRRENVPLYLLTSQGTASAAEEFSFVLKNKKRATLVGDRTAGAGHMVGGFPVGHGFVGRISITRVMDAESGLEWETVGVLPDIKVAPEIALETAHALALEQVAKTRAGLDARVTELLAETIRAGIAPATTKANLAALAGDYDEGRKIEYRDGKLWLRRRPGVMAEPLTLLPNGSFALASQRIRFTAEKGRTVMTTETADGTTLSYARLR